jgi:hypothetical protein
MDAAPPAGKGKGFDRGHHRYHHHGKGKGLGGRQAGPWHDLWRILSMPLNAPLAAKVNIAKENGGSAVTVMYAKGEAKVQFPGVVQPGIREFPGMKTFVYRDQEDGMLYSFQVYGDLSRFGFAEGNADTIVEQVDARWNALTAKLGVTGVRKVSPGDGDTTVWSGQLEKAMDKGPPAMLYQHVLIGQDLFVVATVVARKADEGIKGKVDAFFDSIALSKPDKDPRDVIPVEEPFWPAVIEDTSITQWPSGANEEQEDFFLALPRGDEGAD